MSIGVDAKRVEGNVSNPDSLFVIFQLFLNKMKCYSARYCLAILLSVGLAIVYGLKVNFHVAVVAMVNHTALAKQEGEHTDEGVEDGPFLWGPTMRGTQLSAYFWGYMVAQLPGGRVAEVFSAKWVFFFSVAINVVFTILTPLLAEIHAAAIILMRVVNGIGGGVSFPATHSLLARWSPPAERSIMSSIAYCGTAAGTVLFTLFAGLIADGLGWMWVYYLEGGISIIWLVFWVFLASDSPNTQRFISPEEKKFILDSFAGETSADHSRSFPWKDVFTSLPFWAIVIAHFCSNWGWYMVLTELPTYMKDVLKFQIKNNAILSAIPYFCMFVFSLILGKSIDVLSSKGVISTTIGRKLATFIASFFPMCCFIVLCFITEPTPAVILMTVAIMCIGGMYCGFLSNHIDISPNYAGTLMALTNTIATIPGIVVPIFVGCLTEGEYTFMEDCILRNDHVIHRRISGLHIVWFRKSTTLE